MQKVKKIKGLISWDAIITFVPILALVLAVTGAFGLGLIDSLPQKEKIEVVSGFQDLNYSAEASNSQEIASSRSPENTSITSGDRELHGPIVASKNGSKYYLLSCAGANRIKEENKVYFTSVDEAERAGYGPASNCF